MVFAFSRSRGAATPKASPGGRASAFCEPVTTKSSPQESVSTGEPPTDVTPSTMTIPSGSSRTAAAISATGLSAPVADSECTSVTASAPDFPASSRTWSASKLSPSSTFATSSSLPQACAMSAKRCEKAPFTRHSTLFRTPLRIAASIRPVAEDVEMITGCWVRKTERRDGAPAGRTSRTARSRVLRLEDALLDDVRGLDEANALLGPLPEQVLGGIPVDRLHCVLHGEQPQLRVALDDPLDGVLVAHVEGDAVEHDGVWREHAEHRFHVLVGEGVEPVLVEQDVALVGADALGQQRPVHLLRIDDERVAQGRLGDLRLALRAAHAVLGEGLAPVRPVRQLAVTGDVVVGAGDDADPVLVGVGGEAREVGDDGLGLGHVQLAVGPHEVVLGIDVPEDRVVHGRYLRGELYCGAEWRGRKGR